MIANALAVVSVVAAVAFTGTIVVLKLRRRKPKPLFQDEYFRDVPSADHPAVLSALMSWNEVPDQAYIATLMKLTDDRVIKLEQATVTKAKKGLLGREKEEQTYRVTVSDAGWKSAKGIDRMVLKVFFAGVKPDENGDCSRTFNEVQHYVKQHATPVGDKLEDYQNTVKGKLADSEYVASDGIVAMVFCLFLGIRSPLFPWDPFSLPTAHRRTLSPRLSRCRLCWWRSGVASRSAALRRKVPRWRPTARRLSIGSRTSRA